MINLKTLLPVVLALVLSLAADRGRAADDAPVPPPPPTETIEERLARVEKLLAESPKPTPPPAAMLSAGFRAEFYGFVKFDMAYDNARTDNGNFARWVEAQAVNTHDDEFNATINQTRFGIKILGTAASAMKPSLTFELDLYGNGLAENKPEPMIRHAFIQLDFPDVGFSLIGGQTWDLISPLNPSTINYTVLWWNGNVGYRRPQLRATQTISFGDTKAKLILAAAITRNMGHDNGLLDPGCTGEDAGVPGFQWRVAISAPVFTDKPAMLGFSGHWLREEWDLNPTDSHYNRYSTSLNLDLTLPLTASLTIRAEAFRGRNLDGMLGGIGQGINTVTTDEIHSQGFWAALTVKPAAGALAILEANAGVGADDPADNELVAASRSRNFAVFINLSCDFGQSVSAGIEYMRLQTNYLGAADTARADRVQTALIYKFN